MSFFTFVLTNLPAVKLLKEEIKLYYPDSKLSFSKGEFLTFKGDTLKPFFPTMARLSGQCFGKKTLDELSLLKKFMFYQLSSEDQIPEELRDQINQTDPADFKLHDDVPLVIQLGPEEFWLCEFRLASHHFQTAGEVSFITETQGPSRAYNKIAEASEAFHLDFKKLGHVLELGSAPGGASFFLLEMKQKVWGVDPAEMDESVMSFSDFSHLKMPFEKLTLRDLPVELDWIVSDLNLPPGVVLDEVKRLVKLQRPKKGLILTLKLGDERYLKCFQRWRHSFDDLRPRLSTYKYLPSHKKEVAFVVLF